MATPPNPLVDLTTLAQLQAYLAATSAATPSDPDVLQGLLTAVSQQIQSWLSRNLVSQNYTANFSGRGGCRISMSQTPITAVASVSVDGQAIPSVADAVSSGFVFSSTQVMLRGWAFCRGIQNVTITYTAGFTEIPADIVQACNEGVLAAIGALDRDPMVTSRKAGDTAEAYAISAASFAQAAKMALTPNVTAILSQYRRVVPTDA